MILPYDDVRSILLQAKSFRVRDCICRKQQDYVGRKCDFPLRVCMSFADHERPPSPDDDDITQEEALARYDCAAGADRLYSACSELAIHPCEQQCT